MLKKMTQKQAANAIIAQRARHTKFDHTYHAASPCRLPRNLKMVQLSYLAEGTAFLRIAIFLISMHLQRISESLEVKSSALVWKAAKDSLKVLPPSSDRLFTDTLLMEMK